MNKKIITLIAIIVFISLISGSYFLYDKLTEGQSSSQIQIFGTSDAGNPNEEEESSNDTNQVENDETDDETNDETNQVTNEITNYDTNDDVNEETIKETTEKTTEEITEKMTDEITEEATEEASQDNSSQHNPAPDFIVYDINNNPVKLSDFIGKPIVLNFWASWCGPCKSEMPHFDECYKEIGDDINFLMINLTDGYYGETVAKASSYIKSENYSFPVFYDTTSEAAITYQVYSIPTTYFIDANGNLVAKATGAINKETLLRCIDMIK